MKKELTILEKVEIKNILKKSSFIFSDNEYQKLKHLLITKNFKEVRFFLDQIINNYKSDDELLALKEIEGLIFNLTNNKN